MEDNTRESKDIQDHPTIKDKIYECETFAGFKIFEAYEGDKIKEGQRVVLNQEVLTKNSDTQRRNCIGTVVNAGDNRVLWDSEDDPEEYNVQDTTGENVQYNLLLLDNAQSDIHGFIKAGDDKTKISVDFRLTKNKTHSKQKKVLPFLLFASNPYKDIESQQEENEDKIVQGRSRLLHIIRSVSEKSGLPCLDIVEKTLFFQDKVIIHQKTTKETIQMLIKMGEYAFERGDLNSEENEIKYFQRMIEAVSGHVVLPVALSLDNGGFQKHIVDNAVDMKFPIISSKKSTKDATVTLINPYGDHHNKEEYSSVLLATKYLFNIDKPWKVKMEYDAQVCRNDLTTLKDANEASFTDEMPHELYHLDTIICCTVIAVSYL